MKLEDLKGYIRQGDLSATIAAIDENRELIHTIDPKDENWEERTALHCAARHAKLDIAKALVERGAEVYSNPMNTYPPVFVADKYRHFKDRPNAQHLVDYFLNEIPHKADGTNGLGVTINLAARAGWTEIVRKHIERDPLAVHQRGWIGDTPLHWSCHNGHAETVQLLLDAGADIEADEINCYGGKPLHWASEHEPHIVKILLERGAAVDATNVHPESKYFGVTPLQMNVLMDDDCAEATRLLIDAGADVTVQHKGKSLREIAETKGNLRILALLDSV